MPGETDLAAVIRFKLATKTGIDFGDSTDGLKASWLSPFYPANIDTQCSRSGSRLAARHPDRVSAP